jgi:hypothetical protein
LTEEETPHETDRRAVPTEAGKVTVLKAKPPNAFLPPNAGVKPPHGGVATACSVAQSTLLTPRCGVGLNDLLGAKEAGEGKALANLPKTEVGRPERARENLQSDVSEATASVVGKLTTPIFVSEAGQRNACDV